MYVQTYIYIYVCCCSNCADLEIFFRCVMGSRNPVYMSLRVCLHVSACVWYLLFVWPCSLFFWPVAVPKCVTWLWVCLLCVCFSNSVTYMHALLCILHLLGVAKPLGVARTTSWTTCRLFPSAQGRWPPSVCWTLKRHWYETQPTRWLLLSHFLVHLSS